MVCNDASITIDLLADKCLGSGGTAGMRLKKRTTRNEDPLALGGGKRTSVGSLEGEAVIAREIIRRT